MRILYGLLGHGRGHATRALGVLPELRRRHEVLVVAGGDAYDTLVHAGHPVLRVEAIEYAYGPDGERSLWQSIAHNAKHAVDLATGGPTTRALIEETRRFDPVVAICDADPWTHVVASRLGIPRISFDHFGMLAYCRPPIWPGDDLRLLRDVTVYRMLVGRPARVIVSSFYDAPAARGVTVVGPLLRDEVRALRAQRGDYLLAYFNKGKHQLVPHVERALRSLNLPVVVYGSACTGRDGPLDFRAAGNESFLRDLAGCRAVFSTAGNQLIGEALYLGKPALVMPENTPEQRINALAVERAGIGRWVRFADVSAAEIGAFLAAERTYLAAIPARVRVGNVEALAVLEQALDDVSLESRSRRRRGHSRAAWA